MKHALLTLVSLLLVFTVPLLAQTKPYTSSIKPPNNLLTNADLAQRYTPKVTPPSPDTAFLGRYGEFPVELSNGTPSISIPLYEIQSGSLKVPVGISYHASGIKVNDVATSSGLAWTLNAGGAVTKAANCLPDEWNGGFYGFNPPAANTSDLMCYMGTHLNNSFI